MNSSQLEQQQQKLKDQESLLPSLPPLNSLTSRSSKALAVNESSNNVTDSLALTGWRTLVYEDILNESADKIHLLSKIANNTVSAHIVRLQKKDFHAGGSQDLISSDIDKLRKTRTELAGVLKRTCRYLVESNNFEPLADYIEQYQQSHKEDEAIANQTMGTYKKRLDELRAKVQQKQTETDVKLKEMDQNIQTLQDTEVELKQLIVSRQKFFQKDQSASESILKSQNDQTEREAQQQISKLKEQVQYENTAHKQVMDFLAWQRDEYGLEVGKFMDKFEQENEEKTKELAYLKDLKDDLAGKTREMQSQYEVLSKQVAEEKEERRKKLESFIQMRAQLRCAKLVQRWWKKVKAERKARKEAAEAAAAAAKKGGGKKKGKK